MSEDLTHRIRIVIRYWGFDQDELKTKLETIEQIAKLHPEMDFEVEFRED